MEIGSELSFEGIAKSFVKDPYMMTVIVEKDKLEGWTGQERCSADRHKSTAKKPGSQEPAPDGRGSKDRPSGAVTNRPSGPEPTVDGAGEKSHFLVLLAVKLNKMLHRAADLRIRRHFYGPERRKQHGDN